MENSYWGIGALRKAKKIETEFKNWRMKLVEIGEEVLHEMEQHGAAGYRQVCPREAPMDVNPIADELAKLIINGGKDERLQWSANGHVRVLTGKIILASFKQTLEGRRKRFMAALEQRLVPHGWTRRGSWW